jgi:tetratricopeptide (TPR) repeat protein
MDIRMKELAERLRLGRDDARALVAAGFYALLGESEIEQVYAARYLEEAVTLGPTRPDLWYLRGRLHARLEQREEAIAAWRRQMREHPGAPATRLAVNDLAQYLATTVTPREDLEAILPALESQISLTPDEAAMHDTRGRVLLALGRKGEALAALRRAYELSPSDALRNDIADLARQVEK